MKKKIIIGVTALAIVIIAVVLGIIMSKRHENSEPDSINKLSDILYYKVEDIANTVAESCDGEMRAEYTGVIGSMRVNLVIESNVDMGPFDRPSLHIEWTD